MELVRCIFVLAFAGVAAAQNVPAPQIGLSGNVGIIGAPILNSGTFQMPSDANVTFSNSNVNTSAFSIKVTSAVTLTATRSLIYPAGRFHLTVENATTGGQSIIIIGASGTGVTIANGATVAVWNDGTNFVQVGSAGGGSGTVTHTTGALTALHEVIGNGSGDVKADTGCTTDGAGNKTCASYAATGPNPMGGTAGLEGLGAGTFGAGAIPAGVSQVAPTSVPTAYVEVLPSAVPSTGQVRTVTAVNSVTGGSQVVEDWVTPGGGSGTLVNNFLFNSPTTAPFFCETDSIGLPQLGNFCLALAGNLGISSGQQHIVNVGSASLPDMLSCNTAGAGNCTQNGTWPLTFPLGVVANSKALLESAYNDLSNMSGVPTSNQLSYYYGGLKAWALEFGIPDASKIPATSCTTTGTWTAATSVPGHGTFPTGTLQTSTPGATITCTASTATDAGFIGLKTTGSTTATYTISVTQPGDPSSPYSVADPYTLSSTLNQTAYYTTAWSGISNLYAIGKSGMAGGYTTVTLTTASNSSDPVYVVGPYFLAQSTSPQNAPAVEMMLETRACGNGTCSTISGAQHNDSNTNAMRAAQTGVVNELRSNGMNISYFDPNAPGIGFDPKDPNQSTYVNQFTVTAGGSGYTSVPTVVFSGCTVEPTAVVTISSGAVVTGTFNTTTSGNCNGGTPTIAFTGGGGSSAAATSGSVNIDGTHPNVIGGQNIANAAVQSLNSAATASDHFLPSPVASGGGCSTNCTITGTGSTPALTLNNSNAVGLAVNSTNASGSAWTVGGSGTNVDNWMGLSAGNSATPGGKAFFLGDLTTAHYSFKTTSSSTSLGVMEFPFLNWTCWTFDGDVTTHNCDGGISRLGANSLGIGSAQGASDGALSLATLNSTTVNTGTVAGTGGNLTITGAMAINSGSSAESLALTSSNASGTYIDFTGSGTGVHHWIALDAGTTAATGNAFLIGDITSGTYSWKQSVSNTGLGYIETPALMVNCWSFTLDVTTSACDTGISRDSAGVVDVGNGTQGDTSGAIKVNGITLGALDSGSGKSSFRNIGGTVTGNTNDGTTSGGGYNFTAGSTPASLLTLSAVGATIVPLSSPKYSNVTTCTSSASPAVCGSAPAGFITIAASATTITVNTTAVTASSQIFIQPDETLGTALGVTCNSTLSSLVQPVVTGRVAGTSFTLTTSATIITNPACYSYNLVN